MTVGAGNGPRLGVTKLATELADMVDSPINFLGLLENSPGRLGHSLMRQSSIWNDFRSSGPILLVLFGLL